MRLRSSLVLAAERFLRASRCWLLCFRDVLMWKEHVSAPQSQDTMCIRLARVARSREHKATLCSASAPELRFLCKACDPAWHLDVRPELELMSACLMWIQWVNAVESHRLTTSLARICASHINAAIGWLVLSYSPLWTERLRRFLRLDSTHLKPLNDIFCHVSVRLCSTWVMRGVITKHPKWLICLQALHVTVTYRMGACHPLLPSSALPSFYFPGCLG